MYNLLMVSKKGYWDQSPATFDINRIFEYTSKTLAEKYAELQGASLSELLSFPCLFAYETASKADARLGVITGFRKRGQEVRIEFAFDPVLPAIGYETLEKLVWELDIGEWEQNRTHWAVKEVDLLNELIEKGLISKKQLAESPFFAQPLDRKTELTYESKPVVFRVPASGIEKDLVAVMRPFNDEFVLVQASLEQTCDALKLRCLDVNKVWNETEIIQDIFSLIYRASVVICDFSDRNPNVFYEAGIAHTLGRAVIPIVQNDGHVPFDLQHHRYIKYEKTGPGLAELRIRVSDRLKTLFKI